MTAHFTSQQRQLIFSMKAQGKSLRQIAKQLGCSHSGIDVALKRTTRNPRPVDYFPRASNLKIEDREQILIGINQGLSLSEIARKLSRSPSTITREVKQNGGRDSYSIWKAHERARIATKRPKPSKLENKELCEKVSLWLKKLWSPQEISQRLKVEFNYDENMQVELEK